MKQMIHDTSQLMRTGILAQLLVSIKTDVLQLSNYTTRTENSTNASSDNKTTTSPNIQLIRLKVDIIFFAFYQSQIEEDEARLLLELIKLLSDLLVGRDINVLQSVRSSQPIQQFNFAAVQQLDHNAVVDWYPSLYSLLVILQLAHVCAMQQTTYLLSRHVDYSQYHSIDDLEEGNNLPQSAGSRCGLEVGQWRCDGARGFTCLSFAVFRQPEVDAGRAPAADVEWFLHAACRLRAYSYIRLCILPVLRAAYLHDKERGVFYATVLCELLENLSKVFCMTHYHQLHAHNENDFPYLFFPPTADFFHLNVDFYCDQASSSSSRPPLDHQTPLSREVDSLDDVLSAFTSVLELRPEFAQVFWPQSGDLQHRTLCDHQYHPFVMKAVDASYHHPSLILAAIRFVAALSDCPLGRTAYAGYVFVADSTNQRLSWPHFFDCMDRIALQLGAAPPSSSSTGTTGQGRFGPGALTGRSTSQLPVVRSSAPFHLSDRDVEGLVAIMKLIAAVAVHPAAASQLHESYRPIPRLFALLSCAVPISLKGSILHALASLARTMSSEREEIWELVESYRLLPHHSSASTAGRKGGLATATAGKGLRIELEESESRLGRYPVSEGFLRLLDALLSHEVPDSSLGRGYRRPGLMVYLDYLVDDLLLKSHERLYAPLEWPCARSQRWRLVALVLKVLCTVLQQYRINAIEANTVAEAEALLKSYQSQGSSSVQQQHVYEEIVADFREDQAEYLMITAAAHNPTASAAEVSPQRCQRPKTAGFVLMSQLLSRSKLFDYLARILVESDARCLEASFEEYCSSEIGVAVDLLQRMYQEDHPEQPAQQQHHHQRADTLFFDFSFSAGGSKPKAPATPTERLSLSEVGREEHLCDATFWQERALSCAVGLLYECALRETKYLCFYRSCHTQLTLTRTGESGRAVVSPVIVHEVSDLLSNYITGDSRSVLSLVAQAINLPIRSCPCLPAVHVLGVRILEHVALHLSAQRLLADLTVYAAPDTSSDGPTTTTGDSLVTGCAAAIREGYDYSSELNTGCLHYDIVCLGGEMLPVFFSLSSAHTQDREEVAPPHNVHLCMVNAEASASSDEGRIESEYVLSQQQCASMREAVLHLILTTLTPRCYSLSHRLLGLSASSLVDEHRLSAVATGEGGCLSAVLHILAPDHHHHSSSTILGTSFIQQYPAQAVDCFELVYRLSASPLTSRVVLRLLADRHVDFMRGQLTLILYLMHLSDEELLDGVTMTMITGGESNSGYYVVVRALKTAICTCLGWLLKTCALYLLQAGADHRAHHHHHHCSEVLSLLFGSCKQLSFAAERSSDVSVVEKTLLYAMDNAMDPSETNHAVVLSDPAMQSLLHTTTTQQYVGRGGSGWEQYNQFLTQDVSSGSAFLYPVIDVRALGECLRVAAASDRPMMMISSSSTTTTTQRHAAEAVLQSAVLLNAYHKEVAVHAHLLRSLCQLVDVGISTGPTYDMLLLGSHADHLRSTAPRAADASSLANRLFDQMFLPVSRALLTGRLQEEVLQQPKLKESYGRLVLSLVRVFTSWSCSEGRRRHRVVPLSPPQYHRLCRVLLQLLLSSGVSLEARQGTARGRGGLGAVDAVAYRGLLSASITAAIEAPHRCARGVATAGTDYAEEDKSQHLDDDDDDDALAAGRSTSDDYQTIIVQALEERASEVVDVLASDAISKGSSALWRRCSMSALGSVVSALGTTDSQLYSGNILGKRSSYGHYPSSHHHHMETGSFALVQALKLLVQRGYLQAIVDRGIGRLNSELQVMMHAAPEADNYDEGFVTCLSLCTHVAASSAEGLEALLASHILDRIVSLTIFLNPPPLPSELAIYAGGDDDTSREVALSRLQKRFFACASLLRCMFAADPLSQPMASSTAKFLSKNSVFVSQIVRLRYLSLDGLAIAEAVCTLFAMVAAVPFSERQHPNDKVPRDNSAGLQLVSYERSDPAPGVCELLGLQADEFTRDLTMLLGLIGRYNGGGCVVEDRI